MDASLAYHLGEAALSEDQVIAADEKNGYRVTATVRQSARLRWWILGMGASVEVVQPQSLRDIVETDVAEAHRNYQR